jgi:HEAT repeat protein
MKNTQLNEVAISAIVAISVAVQNLRLYPESGTVNITAIESAYRSTIKALEHKDPLVFTETDGDLLICWEALRESELKNISVEAFIELLISQEIRSVTFTKGLEQAEFREFLVIVSSNPEDITRRGGLEKLVAAKNIRHILADYTRQGDADRDENRYSKDVKTLNIEETFVPMVFTMDRLLDGVHKDKVADRLAASLAGMNIGMLATVLTQDFENDFGEKLFHRTLSQMGEDKFEDLIISIRRRLDDAALEIEASDLPGISSVRKSYRKMMTSDMGERLQSRIQERQGKERLKHREKIADLKSGLNRILKGDSAPFKDSRIMGYLPKVIMQMFAKDNNKTAWALVDRLGSRLLDPEKEIRNSAAVAFLAVVAKLFPEKRLEAIDRFSNEMIGWVKLENATSRGYEKICRYLEELARDYIKKRQFSGYYRIAETFRQIQGEDADEEEATQEFAAMRLSSITTADVLDLLMEEFQTNTEKQREQAISSLVTLGEASAEGLLDLLKESRNRSERARIIQMISDIGEPAVPALTRRIRAGEAWYYMRNLIRLLGKIGSERDLEVIRPFLMHEDSRVQREALNTIYAIGGEQRTKILLSRLAVVEDHLKTEIVGMLGALKSEGAVPVLLEILESKSHSGSKASNELEEKICHVLGSLGSPEAIPVLNSIVQQKRGLLTKKTYNEKIHKAAERALEEIHSRRENPPLENPSYNPS